MRFCFIKPDLQLNSDAQYAGGQHGYLCAAQALAAAGHQVHLLYCLTKPQLMFTVMQQGCMNAVSYSSSVEGVAVWSAHGITHHVSLADVAPSTQQQLSSAMAGMFSSPAQVPALSTPHQRLIDECNSLISRPRGLGSSSQAPAGAEGTEASQSPAQHPPQHSTNPTHPKSWVVLDADGSQEALPGSSSSSNTGQGCSLLEACCAVLHPRTLLLLVQNIHFLPLGPWGIAPRTPSLLQCWSQLGGVLCVSNFVARYVAQHTAPLGLPQDRILLLHYAAVGAFGRGPFHNYGTAAAQQLPWTPPHAATHTPTTTTTSSSSSSSGTIQHHQGSSPSSSQLACWRPTIGCLKLSPEKGGALFLDLARALPQLQFLAVCADPTLQEAAAALPNVRLVPPGDVDTLLQHMTLLLAPSVWQEAYGMVVTEALLRGIPVIVSDQGGLAEAALGAAAAVVTVTPMELKGPRWEDRVFPAVQELEGWVAALQALLTDRGRYEACSSAGRERALELVGQQGVLLQQLVGWLEQQQQQS